MICLSHCHGLIYSQRQKSISKVNPLSALLKYAPCMHTSVHFLVYGRLNYFSLNLRHSPWFRWKRQCSVLISDLTKHLLWNINASEERWDVTAWGIIEDYFTSKICPICLALFKKQFCRLQAVNSGLFKLCAVGLRVCVSWDFVPSQSITVGPVVYSIQVHYIQYIQYLWTLGLFLFLD